MTANEKIELASKLFNAIKKQQDELRQEDNIQLETSTYFYSLGVTDTITQLLEIIDF